MHLFLIGFTTLFIALWRCLFKRQQKPQETVRKEQEEEEEELLKRLEEVCMGVYLSGSLGESNDETRESS